MFLSNTLRAIPAVRHLDIDLLLYDTVQHLPVLMVEESTDWRKNDAMTRKIASFCKCPQARVITHPSQTDTVRTTVRDGMGGQWEFTAGGMWAIGDLLRWKLEQNSSAPRR